MGGGFYIIILKIINQTIKILSCITQQRIWALDQNLGGKDSAFTLTLLDKSLPVSGLSFSICTMEAWGSSKACNLRSPWWGWLWAVLHMWFLYGILFEQEVLGQRQAKKFRNAPALPNRSYNIKAGLSDYKSYNFIASQPPSSQNCFFKTTQ